MDQAEARKALAKVRRSGRGLFAELMCEGRRKKRYPLHGDVPEVGSVVEVFLERDRTPEKPKWVATSWNPLAAVNDPRLPFYDVLDREGISPLYPTEVEREVRELLARPGIDDPELCDLTHMPFVTIDNDDSRDLDQALFIERGPDPGSLIVRYALADASFFVRPGSALFEEALSRGVSYYFPRMVVPMLPPELSEGIISLNPDVERRALVFVMTLDRAGVCVGTKFQRARILSRAKLTYNGVQAFHDDPNSSPLKGQEFTESLELIREVGERRILLSRQRDVVHFRRLDILVDLCDDPKGRYCMVEEERNDVSLWNEQISLLCNIEGAKFLSSGTVPRPHVQPVYRVHDAPSEESLNDLASVINSIAALHELDPDLWCWKHDNGKQSLADYLDNLPVGGETERVRQSIERQVLIRNHRSVFSSEPGQHFALGVTPYSRFSSPMREVVGIFTHKEALEKLRLVAPNSTPEEDEELRSKIIASANASKERQRRITKSVEKLAVDDLLHEELKLPKEKRQVYSGTILGVKATRLYIRLDDPPAEIKVYTHHLEDLFQTSYLYTPGALTLLPHNQNDSCHFRVGDSICLRCLDYDRSSGKWNMSPDGCSND